jgi:hypothetical protein
MKTLAFQANAGGPVGALRRQIEDWWMDLPEAVRSPAWPTAIAALIVVFLLLAFHQVVRDAVRQGELLRMATATHSEAAWRCSSLRGLRMRESCLAQMNAAPNEETPLRNTATVATVAQLGR